MMESIGLEGFFWWFGVVEDREDPEKLGRVRVRVYNFHGDKIKTPTDDLQWAFIIVPPTNPSTNKIGISPNGLMKGSTVFGFFADGKTGQMPIILGSLHGIPNNEKDKHDVSLLARETDPLNKQQLGPEPKSSYSAVYPFNKVYQSEGGHVIEIDDTPNKERIHLYHRSGTYTEINNEGRSVRKIVDSDYEITVKDKIIFVKGNKKSEVKGNYELVVDGSVNITVKGDYNLNVEGDVKINGKSVVLNRGTKGAARIDDTTDEKSGTHKHKISSGSKTVFIGE